MRTPRPVEFSILLLCLCLLVYLAAATPLQLLGDLQEAEEHLASAFHRGSAAQSLLPLDPDHHCHSCIASHPTPSSGLCLISLVSFGWNTRDGARSMAIPFPDVPHGRCTQARSPPV